MQPMPVRWFLDDIFWHIETYFWENDKTPLWQNQPLCDIFQTYMYKVYNTYYAWLVSQLADWVLNMVHIPIPAGYASLRRISIRAPRRKRARKRADGASSSFVAHMPNLFLQNSLWYHHNNKYKNKLVVSCDYRVDMYIYTYNILTRCNIIIYIYMYIFMNHPVSIVPAVPLGEVYDRPESLSAGCKNGHMFC